MKGYVFPDAEKEAEYTGNLAIAQRRIERTLMKVREVIRARSQDERRALVADALFEIRSADYYLERAKEAEYLPEVIAS